MKHVWMRDNGVMGIGTGVRGAKEGEGAWKAGEAAVCVLASVELLIHIGLCR
jgi:hypothetical protein